MVANCPENDRDANGRFAEGNQLGGSRLGVPNKAAWIRDQILATCDEKRIKELKNLDPKLYWDVVTKLMPKQIQAEMGGAGSFAEAATLAAQRAGLTMKTQLGTACDV